MPIPGTKRVKYLEDNMGAIGVELTADDKREIAEACDQFEVSGERYPEGMMEMVHR